MCKRTRSCASQLEIRPQIGRPAKSTNQRLRNFFFVENLYNSLSSAISSHMIRPQVGEFSLRVSSNKEKHSTKVQCLEFRSSDRMYSSLSTSKNHLTRTISPN